MKTTIGRVFLVFIVASSVLWLNTLIAQPVVRGPDKGTLQERWTWAVNQGHEEDVWIGYSIDRLMGENSWTGMFRSVPEETKVTLYELITGRHIEYNELNGSTDLRETARRALARADGTYEEKEVLKEVAFLFRFEGKERTARNLRSLHITNISLEVELDGAPLLWLGKVSSQESLAHVRDMYSRATGEKAKERLISAIGLHGPSEEVFGALRSVIESDEPDDVREKAVFWVSQQETKEGLEYLVELAEHDKSVDVAERAVFGISQVRTEAATDELISLGRRSPRKDVREKAVFWLGQRASKKALESLKGIAYEDENEDIQKKAVFALGQMENGGGVEEMIRIARTHPNPKIRKHAIFWLGQCEDPRAFDAIVAIAKGR